MSEFSRAFWRRLAALVGGLAVAVAVCIALAVFVQREASEKLRQLAHVELEAALLARQFRAAVDDLHGALLRSGTDSSADSAAVIAVRRQRLSAWLAARQTADGGEIERRVVAQMATEVASYFVKLDALAAGSEGFSRPLDRDTIVMFDDSANRLQSSADDFAAAHDGELRGLLEGSLQSLGKLRDLVFLCLGLLLVAIAVMVAWLYRDVVRPLRAQLVESEALLAKREKLAALGTLAAGVAHEIRNPLTAIKARLYTLRRAAPTGEAQEDARAIGAEIDRLEAIVRDVLGYARPAEPKFAEVELAAWLRELAGFEAPGLCGQGVELLVEAPAAVVVHADAGQLRQILLNLIRNAAEAFDGRPGRIRLEAGAERWSVRGVTVDGAVLSVADNGPGIPAERQARLFDPFFTTKAAGTGLGLSIVARLVETHGGQISFQSAPGVGTKFQVRLPARQRPQKTSAA